MDDKEDEPDQAATDFTASPSWPLGPTPAGYFFDNDFGWDLHNSDRFDGLDSIEPDALLFDPVGTGGRGAGGSDVAMSLSSSSSEEPRTEKSTSSGGSGPPPQPDDQNPMPNKGRKKAQKRIRQPRFAFMTKTDADNLEDGYRWRKYGQKAVKNSPFPRSYYRCTNSKCTVKKRVERSSEDPTILITTYEGQHCHHSVGFPRVGIMSPEAVLASRWPAPPMSQFYQPPQFPQQVLPSVTQTQVVHDAAEQGHPSSRQEPNPRLPTDGLLGDIVHPGQLNR